MFLLYEKIKNILQNILFTKTALYLWHKTYFKTNTNILL
jgi:hypothetical protein